MDEEFMQKAVEKAREGLSKGQTPFAACIVKDNEVIACEHNTVWSDTNATAHAEVNAIKTVCHKLNTIDLSDCTIYSTTEPCPMCYSAIHWARIKRIVYGASINDAKDAGFNEMSISNEKMKELAGDRIEIAAGVLEEECSNLFKEWLSMKDKRAY